MYYFILGHNPTLSIAEALKVLNKCSVVEALSSEVLLIDSLGQFQPPLLQQQLGGTIKIGEIIDQYPLDNLEIIEERVLEFLSGPDKKFFGFSLYLLDASINPQPIFSQLESLAMKIKKSLKQAGVASRWVSSRERTLSSVIVKKNRLLDQGAEFCFLLDQNKFYLGKTITCQDFNEYSFYDFHRPARAIDRGMLPPKLAKMMINLAQTDKNKTVLDPFCGTGTILQEAIKMGYQNLWGTDIDAQAIHDTQKNMKWLLDEPKFKNQDLRVRLKIQKGDARSLSKIILPHSIEAIITEPYLGPLKKSEIDKHKSEIMKELSDFYLEVFDEFKKILAPEGRIVILLPAWQNQQNKIDFLPIVHILKQQGWKIDSLISPELAEKYRFLRVTQRGSIVYSRPDQTVLRELLVFRR